MNIDVTKCVAEIVATSFDADRPALRRYSATVVLHSPDKAATRRSTGYGSSADSARISAIRKAWGCDSIAPEEVRVSSRTLPDGYGMPYLTDADKCMSLANRMPAESQSRRDILAVAAAYERQYLEERYTYLCGR